jgi:hypothetical protein
MGAEMDKALGMVVGIRRPHDWGRLNGTETHSIDDAHTLVNHDCLNLPCMDIHAHTTTVNCMVLSTRLQKHEKPISM